MRRTRRSLTALLLCVTTILSCGKGGEEPRFARVDALLDAGEFAQAVQLLAPEGPPAGLDPEAATRLVKAYWGAEELPKAVRVCRETLQAHPGATRVSLQLSQIYFSLGQYEESVAVLRAARDHGAPDRDVALALGVSLGRMEDLEGAREEFERGAAAGASRADVDYNMAVLLGQFGKHGEAEELLRGVHAAHPEHMDARRELARVLLCVAREDSPRLEEAVDHLNAALDGNPQDWRANELLGDAYMLYGDPEAAVFFYTKALEFGRNPEHVEDKYRVAAQARNDLLREQGLLKEDPNAAPQKDTSPPIPDSLQQRWDRARRARAAEEAAAGSDEDGATEQSDGSGL